MLRKLKCLKYLFGQKSLSISFLNVLLLIVFFNSCSQEESKIITSTLEIPDILFKPEIIVNEEFDNPGYPSVSNGNYWYVTNKIYPGQSEWTDFIPGDGFAYIKVDADPDNDGKASGSYQNLAYGLIGPGHRLEVRMKGAVVDGGLVSFIFTYNEIGSNFNEIDVELVADDTKTDPEGHDRLPPDGWTDIRLNTWRNCNVNAYSPGSFESKTISNVLKDNSPISHLDDEFHTYTIDWRAERINYYIDDVLQATHTKYVATGDSEVILGFRRLIWAGDFNWTGINAMMIDYFKIETIQGQPSAKFAADKLELTSGEIVTFYDQSPTAIVWEWDFPGGTPSTSKEENPQIAYNKAGLYEVKLKASNSHGSRETIKTSYIKVN